MNPSYYFDVKTLLEPFGVSADVLEQVRKLMEDAWRDGYDEGDEAGYERGLEDAEE